MKTKKLVLLSLFTALCFIGTWIHIPVPTVGTNAMIHLGTTVIFIIAILIGKNAAIPAGLGCALFDLFSPGYALWVIPTLITKGLMGYAVGKIAFANGKKGKNPIYNIIGFVIGGIVSLTGYFIFNWIFFKGWEGAVSSLITSFGTTIIGLLIAIPLSMGVKAATNRFIEDVFISE
ncbi:ECF transporter S component [Clostridium paraputrificum]|uniref:ECF transporter S component n=1 Tax=Clostridium TaxID=1485 RepID=UPI003D351EE9